MKSVRLSQADSPLSISRPLKTNPYKDEERGLGSGSSSLKNSRIGVMGLLKCGALEIHKYGHKELVTVTLKWCPLSY